MALFVRALLGRPTLRAGPQFRNLCVKLRGSLCDVLKYVSAYPLVFLDLAKNCRFMKIHSERIPVTCSPACSGVSERV